MHGIAASQPYVIAFFLLWAGLMKLLSRRMRAQAGRTALARLSGPARAVPALRLVGLGELAVAAALLLPPLHLLDAVAAALLSAGFLVYLAYASVAAPASSCGCLGTHSRPVDVRAFARAGLLLAAALLTALGTRPAAPGAGAPGTVTGVQAGLEAGVKAGVKAADGLAAPVPAVIVLEVIVLLALSAELDRYWLTPLRRLLVRLRRPLAAPPQERVPLEASLHLLRRSPAYCSAAAGLTSDVLETWDEDGMRFVVYGARDRTAVFAVPLSGDDPGAVRVALVAEPPLSGSPA
ncbi:MauE/DoxX family redox-associated membrane protein [Nonomuraea candida]|uniref:MauE/DoxX family redox-associated membrane protein n=1 Tax=Nonomuraea candida TaxID=359159 RepID=UPI0005B7E678|nr:MauE/DoxX family redox-associated membrane protein [Nonomuraea candida]